MKRLHAIGSAILLAAVCRTQASASPTVSDFQGTWRVSRLVGGASGGVTAGNPDALLRMTVVWTASGVRSPEGQCTFKTSRVVSTSNRELETSLWGGQAIARLNLTGRQIKEGFGGKETFVFRDENDCSDAVLIGRDQMVFELGSGWIYLLDRVGD